MRRIILSMALATAVISANAQDMNSKRGTPILPEVKDWTIGVDATPFLDYAGNLFSQYGNSAPSFDFAKNPLIITGGMVKDETTTYRVMARIGFNSSKDEDLIDATWTTEPNDQATDVTKTSSRNITLGAGIQKNRGKGRLRGIYGAEAMIMFGGGKSTFENGTPDTLLFTPIDIETKQGSTLGLGLRAFISAEYFFAPKISISGEFGWGLSISSQGEGETTSKQYGDDPSTPNDPNNVVYETTSKSGKSSSFGIDTDNLGGAIIMHFYF